MRLCTFEYAGATEAGILKDGKVLPISQLNSKRGANFPLALLSLIQSDEATALKALAQGVEAEIPLQDVRLRIPYANPGKVWCIGLNYRSHAEDLSEVQPDEPGSFMKPSSSFFEPGGAIELPPEDLTSDVDAEGELALVFGKRCRDVPLEEVPSVLFGYTTTLDMTALDILARNTRYLQRSKSFDTFFSFGPVIVTADEIHDVNALEVQTIPQFQGVLPRLRLEHAAPPVQSRRLPLPRDDIRTGRHSLHGLPERRTDQARRHRGGPHRRRGATARSGHPTPSGRLASARGGVSSQGAER